MSKFSHETCDESVLEFYYKNQKLSFGKGLARLESEDDMNGVLMNRDGHPYVKIYVVTPVQSYALSLHISRYIHPQFPRYRSEFMPKPSRFTSVHKEG